MALEENKKIFNYVVCVFDRLFWPRSFSYSQKTLGLRLIYILWSGKIHSNSNQGILSIKKNVDAFVVSDSEELINRNIFDYGKSLKIKRLKSITKYLNSGIMMMMGINTTFNDVFPFEIFDRKVYVLLLSYRIVVNNLGSSVPLKFLLKSTFFFSKVSNYNFLVIKKQPKFDD